MAILVFSTILLRRVIMNFGKHHVLCDKVPDERGGHGTVEFERACQREERGYFIKQDLLRSKIGLPITLKKYDGTTISGVLKKLEPNGVKLDSVTVYFSQIALVE